MRECSVAVGNSSKGNSSKGGNGKCRAKTSPDAPAREIDMKQGGKVEWSGGV